ncbi:FabD/lysophospholipase-like protein [Schizopora paradoxa]|uniref:FabD/lysophospholipase-like protein n=1 Tax=Schizopora paradoxa TaxID=27342 RepID=A0A0H2R3S1_9AGAM|nr:FabD/lysophospholipase-like protein [Schizopora paradoxa]
MAHQTGVFEFTQRPPAPPITAVCFDGGGVRGIAAALVMEAIMKKLEEESGGAEPELVHNRFDVLAGTSTGGLLAILLGQLHVPANDAFDLLRNASQSGRFQGLKTKVGNVFSSKHGDEDVRRVIEEHWNSSKKTMLYEESPRGLLVASDRSTGIPEIVPFNVIPRVSFTSTVKHCQLKVTVLNVDGGIGRNNPTKLLIKEVRRKHHDKSVRFRLLLSIGSGLDANSAAIHEDVSNDFKAFDLGCYVRVDVPGIVGFGVNDRKAIPKIKEATSSFLSSEPGEKFLAVVVEVLRS